jgi:hypothetical protein
MRIVSGLSFGARSPDGLRPAEDIVNVLDQPASCGDFPAGQAFTADDVMSDHICASICRTARSNARLSRTFSSSPRVILNERSEGPVGDHSDRARDQIPHMAQSMYQ